METADVIVIGLGAVGSAGLYQLARRGVRAVGIDRFAPPHTLGSSHGESRITRQAVGEGEAYVPFALRSHEIWRELEAATGTPLLRTCGGLILGSPPHEADTDQADTHGADFVHRTIGAARRFGIAHEVLGAPELAHRFPQLGLRGDELGYFEPGAGFLDPEACVRTQLRQARALGARIHTHETVTDIRPLRGGVQIRTQRASYEAGCVVVSAGAWTAQLLGEPFRRLLRVYRRVLYWFEPEDARSARAYAPERFPVFIWHHGREEPGHFYGFPELASGVKVATEAEVDPTSPETVEREVSADEPDAMYREHVRGRLLGVSSRVVRTAACLYTSTPDHDFVLDRHPDSERVLVASPCSGHGFKHSAAVGEAMAEWASGVGPHLDLRPFRLSRF